MAKRYKEAPWWWYIVVLVGSFVLGLIVVIKENITLPAWAYIVSLVIGIIIAPLVGIQFLRTIERPMANRRFHRVLCFTRVTETELPRTTYRRCWQVLCFLVALLVTCTLLLGRIMSSPMLSICRMI